MRILAKIFFGLLFLLGASDGLINLLGNSDYIQDVIADPNSSPSMKMIIALATSHSPLVGLVPILVGSVGLYVLLFGIPGWKSKRESEEERIYERVVETHGQGGSDGIPINTFFKCG